MKQLTASIFTLVIGAFLANPLAAEEINLDHDGWYSWKLKQARTAESHAATPTATATFTTRVAGWTKME